MARRIPNFLRFPVSLLAPALLMSQAISLAQQDAKFDPAADFSLSKNPNGVWQYGYSESPSLAPDQFRLSTYTESQGVVGFWHPLPNRGPGPGYYPYVAYNPTNATQLGSQKGWAVRAGQLALEASNIGQYSLVRFIAPQSGAYNINARFEGIHFGLSTTDVHVLKNAEVLFDAFIDGYGGDPKFHPLQGSSPTASFTRSLNLDEGDAMTFAVGYGRNKTHYSDTTGLSGTISLVTAAGNRHR